VGKLKLQVQTTMDGYMQGPNGEMDWMTAEWSDDMSAYSDAVHQSVDCIVLGRPLAEGFIPAWASRRDDPQGESPETIEWMNGTPKVVFSNTLTESPWDNATIVAGDVTEIVSELKVNQGGDLITYGGGPLASSMIAKGLIDDIYVFVNPIAIGDGLSLFGGLDAYARLSLAGAHPFQCGVTALHYQPNGS
jgi:dihydrofolate reductase